MLSHEKIFVHRETFRLDKEKKFHEFFTRARIGKDREVKAQKAFFQKPSNRNIQRLAQTLTTQKCQEARKTSKSRYKSTEEARSARDVRMQICAYLAGRDR